jgi:hypothetical protein
MVMDQEYLEQLRAQAAEVRRDLAEREVAAEMDHEQIMAAMRVNDGVSKNPSFSPPAIVHKTNYDAMVMRQNFADNPSPSGFNDNELLDGLADALAQNNIDMQGRIDEAVAPLRERIAVLEGQLSMLMAMLGDNSKTIEASESETVRKLRVQR